LRCAFSSAGAYHAAAADWDALERSLPMTKFLTVAWMLCVGLGFTSMPISAQTTTVSGSRAIADTIAKLFGGIAEATNALDLDRLLAFYDESDALTYVAQGRVVRTRRAFDSVVRAQFQGLTAADLKWQDTFVDVLSDDVAVATATYELTGTFPDGGTVRRTGTYMCIYVRDEDRWLVRYSAHSFPPR